MRYLKIFGIFLLVVTAVAFVLSMVLPDKQRVEKSIIVKAPVADVYNYLLKLENFKDWSVWDHRDSSVKHTITGTDGTIGASTSWSGNPEVSGKGKMTIASLQANKKIVHNISFLAPKRGTAESELKLLEVKGGTQVTWEFDLATPRPANIFNLFRSMNKEMGKDFEESLINLRNAIEKRQGVTVEKTYEVQRMNFPATSFAQVRQQVKWADMSSFFSNHFSFITAELEKAGAAPGMPAGLFYVWDEKNQQADAAAAYTVPAGTKIDNGGIQVVDIPASKAVYVNYYGEYGEKQAAAYNSIERYLADNNLKQKSPVIEQYIVHPAIEKDTARWLTKIIYLVE